MRSARSYLAALALLAAVWQLGSWLAGPVVLPSPVTVLALAWRELETPELWRHLGASALRVLAALVISSALAVPLGLAIGSSRRLHRWSKPVIYLSYPVPKIVLLPLVLMIFGLGDAGKVAMLTLILFFQLLIPTRDAAREVGSEARISLLSLGGTRLDLFRHVIWPATLPVMFSALRVATGTVVAVLFFVESIATRHGLGAWILDAWGRAATAEMFVGILALAGLGVALYESFDRLERLLCPWRHRL